MKHNTQRVFINERGLESEFATCTGGVFSTRHQVVVMRCLYPLVEWVAAALMLLLLCNVGNALAIFFSPLAVDE